MAKLFFFLITTSSIGSEKCSKGEKRKGAPFLEPPLLTSYFFIPGTASGSIP